MIDDYVSVRPLNASVTTTDDGYGVIVTLIFPDEHLEVWLLSLFGGMLHARKL